VLIFNTFFAGGLWRFELSENVALDLFRQHSNQPDKFLSSPLPFAYLTGMEIMTQAVGNAHGSNT
jgi:hypothetical protein